MTTAQDQQSRAAELRATIDMLDECAKAGKPWPYVPSTESIRAVLDELAAAQVQAMGRVPPGFVAVPVELTAEMVDAAEEAYMPFGDMALAIQSAIAAAPRPPAAQELDEVVITKNESGAIVAVTRQDDEGRILSVLAESEVRIKPLTDEQIEAIPVWVNFVGLWPQSRKEIVRAIESAHGITHPTGD